MYFAVGALIPQLDGKHWEAATPTTYVDDHYRVAVHVGFITDYASIPKIFRWYAQPATGLHRDAALIHDYVYKYAPNNETRLQADQLFKKIMIDSGVRPSKAEAMYRAVRIGSRSTWKKYRREEDSL